MVGWLAGDSPKGGGEGSGGGPQTGAAATATDPATVVRSLLGDITKELQFAREVQTISPAGGKRAALPAQSERREVCVGGE